MDWPPCRVGPLLSLVELPLVRPLLALVPPLRLSLVPLLCLSLVPPLCLSLVEVQLLSLVLAPPLRHPSESLLVLVLSPVQVVLPFAVI